MLISASHTHSGPGAFVDSEALGWLALDRLDPDIRRVLLETVVDAVRRAGAARRPARVAVAGVTAPPVVSSRLGQPLDHEVIVLRVTDAQAQPLAAPVEFRDPRHHARAAQSPDLGRRHWARPRRWLERELGVPALFVNGAVADVEPGRPRRPGRARRSAPRWQDRPDRMGQAEPRYGSALSCGHPYRDAADAGLSLHNCLWRALPAGSRCRSAACFPVTPRSRRWRWETPRGWHSRASCRRRWGGRSRRPGDGRFRHTAVAGLTNDYLGYFLTPADAEYPRYVSCVNLYGPRTGACLTRTAADLVRALGRGEQPPSARVACDADAAREMRG